MSEWKFEIIFREKMSIKLRQWKKEKNDKKMNENRKQNPKNVKKEI